MDFIRIEHLELECIVGVRPRERRKKQPVRLDLGLGLDVSRAGRSGRIALTCDYDRIASEATTLLRFREYQLIEVATEELAAMLFGLHPPLEAVELRLEKPEALRGVARGASIEVARSRADFPRRRQRAAFGEIEVLLETYEAGLYLVHVDPGRSLPAHAGKRRELGWTVAGELVPEVGDHGAPGVWSDGRMRCYENRSNGSATLFCCACPPLEMPAPSAVTALHAGAK